jgi:hypothetical protein
MLKAGLSAVDITPPAGVRQAGYAGRTLPSLAVHDPLWARALVLDDGSSRVGLVGLDLGGVPAALLAQVREQAASRDGIEAEGLLLGATHSHSGPHLWSDEPTDLEREYAESLPARVGEAISGAVASLAEGSVSVASGWAAAGINRRELLPGGRVQLGRNHFGPFDPELGVLRVDDAHGETIGVVMNYAAHALCLAEDNYLLTADYPGHACHYVEDRLGKGVSIFFNGAAGDVNPREGPMYHGVLNGGSFLAAQHAGDAIATETIRVLAKAVKLENSELACASRKIELPTNPERALKAAEERVRAAEAQPRARDYHFDRYLIWDQRVEGPEEARRCLERVKARGDKPVEMVEIQAIAIGDLALLGWAGEVFCELGMMAKAGSPYARTYVLGYANGSVGYIPTPDAYPLGGYEVECALHLADNAGLVLVERSLALLNQMRGR